MKLTLIMEGDRTRLKMPKDGATAILVPKQSCPHCKKELTVTGGGKHIKNQDTYAAPAICVACNMYVGELELQVSTLFGLEEDERVLSMGVKIY